MGRFFGLTLHMSGLSVAPRAKHNFSVMKLFGKLNFGLWVFTLLLVFGVMYIFVANNLSTRGYEMKKIQQQLDQLSDINKKLEIEASELKSIESIKTEVKSLNLVPGSSVKYFRDNGYAYKN